MINVTSSLKPAETGFQGDVLESHVTPSPLMYEDLIDHQLMVNGENPSNAV